MNLWPYANKCRIYFYWGCLLLKAKFVNLLAYLHLLNSASTFLIPFYEIEDAEVFIATESLTSSIEYFLQEEIVV